MIETFVFHRVLGFIPVSQSCVVVPFVVLQQTGSIMKVEVQHSAKTNSGLRETQHTGRSSHR